MTFCFIVARMMSGYFCNYRKVMRKRVYIETTIPSFYYETRVSVDMVARRNWTRQWWKIHHTRFELVTSLAVIEELQQGNHPNKALTLHLIRELPLVPVVPEIERIVDTYVARNVIPVNPKGDALHLALAAYHSCHFLLTWNCRHLANANKFEHIRKVTEKLGLMAPTLTTPVELMEYEENNEL